MLSAGIFDLPEILLSAELIQAAVGTVAAGMDIAALRCLGNGAAGLFQVRAVVEAAFAEIRSEIADECLSLAR